MFIKKAKTNPNDIQKTTNEQTAEDFCPVSQNDTEISDKPPKKKKGKKIAIISGISAAVIAGGGATAYHFSALVRNQVNLIAMKPEKYYVWVNEENSGSFADKTADKYENFLKKYKKGTTSTIELKLDAADAAKDKLLDHLLENFSGTQDELDILTGIINNIDDLSISLGNESKKAEGVISLGTNLNGDSLISLDIALDMMNPRLFMRYPEIQKQWICFDYNDILNDSIKSSGTKQQLIKMLDFYKEIMDDPTTLISPAELKNSINNYADAWNASISDVDRERSEKISVGDITVKYTVLDVDINSKTGIKIIRNFIKEAANDKVIRRIFIDKLELVSDNVYDNAFKTALTSLKQLDDDDDEDISLKTFIDSKGAIRGFSLSYDESEIFYALGKDKDNFAVEFYVVDDGTKLIDCSLNAKESGKDAYSGSISLDIDKEIIGGITGSDEPDNYNITMDFEDMNIGSPDNIKFTGDAVLNIPGFDPITLKFKGRDNKQTIAYTVKIDGEEYGDVSLIFTEKDGSSFNIPNPNDSYKIDSDSYDSFNFYEYIGYDGCVNYLTDLMVKLGIDKDVAEEMAQNYADEIYSPEEWDI